MHFMRDVDMSSKIDPFLWCVFVYTARFSVDSFSVGSFNACRLILCTVIIYSPLKYAKGVIATVNGARVHRVNRQMICYTMGTHGKSI